MTKEQLKGLEVLVYWLKLARKNINVAAELKQVANDLDLLGISWRVQNKVAAYIQHNISYEKMNDSYNMDLVLEAI